MIPKILSTKSSFEGPGCNGQHSTNFNNTAKEINDGFSRQDDQYLHAGKYVYTGKNSTMKVRPMFTGSYYAGVIAAAIACFFIGMVTFLWCINDTIETTSKPVFLQSIWETARLSIIIWLLVWFILHRAWRTKNIHRKKAFRITVTLILAGLLSTLIAVTKIALF